MASTTDVPQPTNDSAVTEQPKNPRPRPSRLYQALAWVGIAAGGLFIVAGVFFSGFFLSWSEQAGPGPMDCCSHMKPDEHMKPGAMMAPGGQMTPGSQMAPGEMMPGKMMGPGGMMGPAAQSLTIAPPSGARP